MANLIAKLKPDFSNIGEILTPYFDLIEKAKKDIRFEGKTMQQIAREQASLPFFYLEKKNELETLEKYMNSKVEKVRGKLTKQYVENYSRELNDKTRERFVDNEQEYLSMYELYLEVKEISDIYKDLCESFTIRGFAFRDLTQLKINQLDDSIV